MPIGSFFKTALRTKYWNVKSIAYGKCPRKSEFGDRKIFGVQINRMNVPYCDVMFLMRWEK